MSIPTTAWREQLDDDERARFAAGEMDAVIASTRARDRRDLTARVRELVWDFEGAAEDWRSIGALVDALRCSIDAQHGALFDALLAEVRGANTDVRRAAVALLERRGRRADAASIEVGDDRDDVLRRARTLGEAGEPLAAATLLHAAGRAREALSALGRLDEREAHGPRWALAAQLHWSLGDAEGTIRAAQSARRLGMLDEVVTRLLARALGSLGHDVAGELVLGSIPRAEHDDTPTLHGRYRVTRLAEASLVGTAYHAVDRTTLQEVEVHLLLGDRGEREDSDGRVRATLERFAAAAEGASRIGHPAIRPVLYVDPRLGVLILPRAAGPALDRHLTARRAVPPVQARAWLAFLFDGLATAHARGIVHGGPFPSTLAEDALGRPTLGPFGVDALSGLAVTRTATLQELLTFSAPERRGGGPATPQSDVWSLGRLLAALVVGDIEGPTSPPEERPRPPLAEPNHQARGAAPHVAAFQVPSELDPELPSILATLCHPDPLRRPSAAEARALVSPRIADATRLTGPVARADAPRAERHDEPSDLDDTGRVERRASTAETHDHRGQLGVSGRWARRSGAAARATAHATLQAIELVAGPSWSDAALAGLARLRSPILQPLLDRDDRTLTLAGWPDGSALAPPDLDLDLVREALVRAREATTRELDDEDGASDEGRIADACAAIAALETALQRLGHEGVVRTPSGEWFLALDALLRV